MAGLADAARCWAIASENEKALVTFQRLKAESPDEIFPPQIEAQIDAPIAEIQSVR